MKKPFIKFFDKIILLLLGLSGIVYTGCAPDYGVEPVPEYGVPQSAYQVQDADETTGSLVEISDTENE